MARGIDLDRSRYPLVVMHASTGYTQEDWNQLMKGMVDLIRLAPFGLINDTRGSAAYRIEVAVTLVRQALAQAGGAA